MEEKKISYKSQHLKTSALASIVIDGINISNMLTSVSVSHKADGVPELTLTFALDNVEINGTIMGF